jgi:transcriptional regulator with XRE-family HTH domain
MKPIAKEHLARHIGAKIALRRIEISLTAEELSQQINLDVASLDEIERGCFFPDAHILLLISDALRVPVQFFYEGMYDEPPRTRDPIFYKRALQVTERLERRQRQPKKDVSVPMH